MSHINFTKFNSLIQIADYFNTEDKCKQAIHQLSRDIKVTQKTAWFMLHKIRGLYGQSDSVSLNGEVELLLHNQLPNKESI